MSRMFSKSKSRPRPEDAGIPGGTRASRQQQPHRNSEEGEGGVVTNYRSFSEHPSNRSSQNSNSTNTNSNNNNNNRAPVSLNAASEVVLEDQRNLNENKYRGFSTSMHDMYKSTEFERVDCCAMTCGGVFQSDRDRFLLHGITPPTIARRFWLFIAFPVLLFGVAAAGAMHIPVKYSNQVFVSGILLLLVVYLVAQCFKGRTKRIEIRKELLWTKASLQRNRNQNMTVLLEQHLPNDRHQEQDYYLGQTQRDFECAHPFCCLVGCYAEDRPAYELRFSRSPPDEAASHERQAALDARRRNNNICKCLWDYACPAIWCGHQVMCCGICALAQEAREVEAAVFPAAYRRIDYISMQPISHYYPAIYKKRHGTNTAVDENGEQTKWINLSNLSWQLIHFALTVSGLVFVWCFLGKYFWRNVLKLNVPDWRIFNWTDFLVYLFAWGQAIVLTAILAYLCNRPRPTHLSLDAMIKFFAAGFCLSTALAVFWELFLGLMTKSILSLLMAIGGVNVVLDEEVDKEQSWIFYGGDSFARTIAGKTESDSYLRAFGNSHPVFYTFYIAFASFCIASFVEEVCKYFGYRMVEHPDFLTQREIEDAMNVVIQQHDEEEEDEDADEVEARRQQQRQQQQHDLQQIDFSKQKKSLQSLGGAITLSMVCVAMGFACCENLVYIFIYSGSTLSMEISVLVARSLFPVHPIAAALMSLRVVERDVEVTRTRNLGGILTPPVLFHGLYDFFILWIDFLSKRNGNYVDNSFDFASFASLFISAGLIVGALIYYAIAASRQRARLQVTDASIESGQSVLI